VNPTSIYGEIKTLIVEMPEILRKFMKKRKKTEKGEKQYEKKIRGIDEQYQ
jgi:hypothetical protein